MQLRFANLLEALQRAVMPPPRGLRGALEGLPAEGELPSPWATWLLICLLRYRQRQRWAVQVLERHLPEALPLSRDLLDRWSQDPPLRLCIPRVVEWELELEPEFCFGVLVHRFTGERITIAVSGWDFDHPLFIETLDRYLKTQPAGSPEGRLLALHPDFVTVSYAVHDLDVADFLCDYEPESRFYHDRFEEEGLHPNAHSLDVGVAARGRGRIDQ